MCGITGYLDLRGERPAEQQVLVRMMNSIIHRGPDSAGYFIEKTTGLGFRRLSIIDCETGNQPIYNEDRSVVLICNGEIFNYRELRADLLAHGHLFCSQSDVEVLVHLYEQEGIDLLKRLNAQFAFAVYDRKEKRLTLARDPLGINPLFYAVFDGVFIFASEIKAILEHPLARRELNLTGLDQVLTFPGVVSPTTLFKDIHSLKPGHYLTVTNGSVRLQQYWDMEYPTVEDAEDANDEKPEEYYSERLAELLNRSIRYRLQADAPVGFYLSGGLDSSLIAALISRADPGNSRHSFSVAFPDKTMCESKYQLQMAQAVNSVHHETVIDLKQVESRLAKAVYHSEMPLKETYNTASLALSESARVAGVKVILTGEGADELFAGYVGYRFDQMRLAANEMEIEQILEAELQERAWGDANLFYDTHFYANNELKMHLYSPAVAEQFEQFNCLNAEVVDKSKLRGRHYIHQRSYLDLKLKLADHLIADHGDRMCMANAIEARYPFLDIDLVTFCRGIPPHLKLNGHTEKYLVRRVAESFVPREIVKREKFAWFAPGSVSLLQSNNEWVNDLLSSDRIKREGYFNPGAVERLKARYGRKGFTLNLPYENDLLMVVLTFGLFLEVFRMPSFS
jgi:asparagine synthase (glutamine-hydrolysing)